jgi:hypothetical protein
VNSPPPKPEVILTNFFAEPTVLLVPITNSKLGTQINFKIAGHVDLDKLNMFSV